MEENISTLLEAIELYVTSEETKKEIYTNFIEAILMQDAELVDALAKENDLFAEVYQEMQEEIEHEE